MQTISIIAAQRKKKNLTLKQVGALCKPPVNKATVSRWENGERVVSGERALDLERVIGLSRKKLRPDLFGAA
jgi:DNA-binding transcriptional regulator YdaS (Cro superfamily)